MSGANASVRRVHGVLERQALDESRVAAMGGLAGRVRELTEATLRTGVPEDELAAITAELDALIARLSASRSEHPPLAGYGTDGMVRQVAGPVTGAINPLAPPVDVSTGPDGTVHAAFTLNVAYEGPPGFVHGGVTAMILDQILGEAAAASGVPGMTATLDLRYRRPTPYGVPLTAQARATGQDGRKSWSEGRVIDPDGKTTVEAAAMFVLPRR